MCIFLLFEFHSPNPNSNTYMVVAATLMAMMDGIEAVADSGKVVSELEASISKKKGEDDFYLMKEYEYRCEDNVFDNYSQNERDELFGMAPKSVWENINNLASSDNLKILKVDDVMTDQTPIIILSLLARTLMILSIQRQFMRDFNNCY